MKNIYKILTGILIVISFIIPNTTHAQATSNFWKLFGTILQPVLNTWSIKAPFFNATSTTATSTFRGFIDVLGTGANATSTISGNLWVKGNQQVDGSLFAPITFAAGDTVITGALTVTGQTTLATSLTGALSAVSGVVSAGTLSVANGGTGLSSYTLGDVIYASGTGTLAGTSTANLKSSLALNLVENTALSTWAGSTNLTTLGTIATGVWSGTAIGVSKGGTGNTTLTSSQLLYGNGTNALSSVATTSLTATWPVSFSNPISVIGDSASIVSLAFGTTTSNTWASTQTFSAIAGVIDAGGATSFEIPNGTDPTVSVAGQVAINTTQASTSLRFYDGTAERVLNARKEFSLPYASTTAAAYGSNNTATTTVRLFARIRPITLIDAYCKTDAGTFYYRFGDGTNWSETSTCNSTGVRTTFSTNNTFTMNEEVQMQYGTQASSPSTYPITAGFFETAD